MSPTLRLIATGLAVASLLGCSASPTPAESTGASETAQPRNVILLIGDGMGPAQVKAYRYYANRDTTTVIDPLPFDSLLVGAVATEAISLDCPEGSDQGCQRDPYGVTDSASSASAYATGEDTLVGRMGIDESGRKQINISQKARRQGIGVGLVATSQITHATPAAFVVHVEGRGQSSDIADQLFDNQHDGAPLPQVLLGGGRYDLQREDRDVAADFVGAGYSLVNNRQELLASDNDKLLGLFAPIGLPQAWDRDDTIPSLAEMSSAAIKALSRNPNGFFLMIEGSQIDWAAHSNDISGVISEMEDFIAAIEVALEFAQAQGNTLVVITADHETGGLSMGRDDIYAWNPRPLRGMKKTAQGIVEEFMLGEEPLSAVVQRNIDFDLTEQEIAELDTAKPEIPPYPDYGMSGTHAHALLSLLLEKRTLTGWSTVGHTGVDVPLYAFGPGSEAFRGTLENEELGKRLQQALLEP